MKDFQKSISKSVLPKDLAKKWAHRHKNSFSFYCPLCSAPRKIDQRPSPSLKHFMQIALTSVFFAMITWEWFTWKGIVSFLPFWITFEVLYRSKIRAALFCDHCGFDPMLYMVDVKRAHTEVDKHWRTKFAEKGIPYPKDVKNSELILPQTEIQNESAQSEKAT